MDNTILDTNRIIGLYAPQNYGKTYAMAKLAREISEHVPVFVYDTNFERLSAYPQDLPNLRFIKAKKISKQETPEFLNTAILTLRANYSNFFLFIEDLDKLIRTNTKSADTMEIFKLASDSRHQRIGICYATKEPTNIPVKLRSNTNLFFIGQFIEPAHLKVINGYVDKKLIRGLVKPEFIKLDRYNNTIEKFMF
jgi:hypothetical protein